MDDLVTWLRQQIAERATWARAAEQAATDSDGYQWKRMASATIDAGDCLIQTDHADIGRFVEDNSPRTVLAQCEAHTAILDLHRQIIDRGHDSAWPAPGHCAECWVHEAEDYQSFPCNTLRALALAYQHRPGYREEWKP